MVGALDDAVLNFLAERGIAPATAAVTIGDKDLFHALRTAKVEPLPVSVWKRLPSLLAAPEAVYWDLQDPGLVYVLNEPEGMGKIVVLIDYSARIGRQRTVVNTVRTGRLVTSLEEFGVKNRYERVEKSPV